MAVTDQFVSDVSEALDQLGYAVEEQGSEDIISDVSQLNDDVTLPGIRVQNNVMTGYVSMKLAVLKTYLTNAITAIQTQWNTWFGATVNDGVQKEWADLKSDAETITNAASDAATAASNAVANANSAALGANTATASAQSAAQAASSAATGAERVNAQLSNNILTVTNRNGVQTSSNVKGEKGDVGDPFAIYRTYASVAAMNADAANVPEGKFVCITSNVEDPDNAKLYVKTSGGSFSFVTDLSGAQGIKGDKGDPFTYEDFTEEQIADLKKPAEDAAADAEKVNASLDGYILTVTDRHGNSAQKNVKGNFIDWSTMSQADKDLLIQTVANEIKNTFVFASNTVCEDIIDEL